MAPQQTSQERAAPKLMDQARRALMRGNTETKDNPEGAGKLHSGDGVSVLRTTLSCSRHRTGLYRRVTREKPMLK